jgi:hypothetical protein
MGRLAAGVVAICGLAGLVIQFSASLDLVGSPQAALWAMLRYFTVIGNLLAVLVLAAIALGVRAGSRPHIIGGVTLLMLLIGVVYATLLRGLLELSGGARLADTLLHYVMPALVTLYWLFFMQKGGLQSHDVLKWAIIPLAYFAYALVRASFDGRYPYPFMNVAVLGWPRTLLNAGGMAFGFLLAGAVLFWIDQMLGRFFGTARR